MKIHSVGVYVNGDEGQRIYQGWVYGPECPTRPPGGELRDVPTAALMMLAKSIRREIGHRAELTRLATNKDFQATWDDYREAQ